MSIEVNHVHREQETKLSWWGCRMGPVPAQRILLRPIRRISNRMGRFSVYHVRTFQSGRRLLDWSLALPALESCTHKLAKRYLSIRRNQDTCIKAPSFKFHYRICCFRLDSLGQQFTDGCHGILWASSDLWSRSVHGHFTSYKVTPGSAGVVL